MLLLKGYRLQGILCAIALALAACTSMETVQPAVLTAPTLTVSVTARPRGSSTVVASASPTLGVNPVAPPEDAVVVATETPAVTPTATSEPSTTPTVTATPVLDACLRQAVTSTPTPQTGNLQIAYIQDGNLALWSEKTQTSQTLIDSGDVSDVLLSPDGKWVVFTRPAGAEAVELWAVKADGTGERLLLSADRLKKMAGDQRARAVQPHHLSWIPGTTRLAFNIYPIDAEPKLYAADDLWTIDVTSGELQNILPHGKGGEFVYSPDGKQIALMTPNSFSLMNANGTNLRWNLLENYQALAMSGSYSFPMPVWAPDSRSLRIGLPRVEDATSALPNIDIWEIPQNGLYPALVTTIRGFPPSLSFSPDLSFLTYITWQSDQSGRLELNLISLDTDPVQSVLYAAGGRLEFLGWSPDARRFAFWLPGTRKLQLGDACASGQALTDKLTDYGSLTWVDANRFLFVAGVAGERELWLGQTGGTSHKLLDLGAQVAYAFVV